MRPDHMEELAELIAAALAADDPAAVAPRTSAFRARFRRLAFVS